jgi:hypothetical protein
MDNNNNNYYEECLLKECDCLAVVRADGSEERIASIIRVNRISELGRTLAETSY